MAAHTNFISALHPLASSLTDASIDPAEYIITRQLHERLVMYAKIDGVSRGGLCMHIVGGREDNSELTPKHHLTIHFIQR